MDQANVMNERPFGKQAESCGSDEDWHEAVSGLQKTVANLTNAFGKMLHPDVTVFIIYYCSEGWSLEKYEFETKKHFLFC